MAGHAAMPDLDAVESAIRKGLRVVEVADGRGLPLSGADLAEVTTRGVVRGGLGRGKA